MQAAERTWCECDCGKGFFKDEAREVAMPDDGDQMYDRGMSGTVYALVCPFCGGSDTWEEMS